jgi:hypothetical protein
MRDGSSAMREENALALTDHQDSLGAEVVLRNADNALAYADPHPGAISINARPIDRETELLAGAVITGTDCSVGPQVTGVRHSIDAKMVDSHVRSAEMGLCEMFGAVQMWVVLGDVTNDQP